MRFEQTKDALNHIRLFHTKLSNFYQSISGSQNTKKVNLLLEYMAEHEKALAKTIDDYEDQAPSENLQTWFQYTKDDEVLVLPEPENYNSGLSIDDIVVLSLELSDELIDLYIDMAEQASTIELKEMFDNLASMQNQEKRKLSINIDRLMDL